MIITAPVTDYIPASVLTTLNDIVIRGAAIPERFAEIFWRGKYIVNSNRNAGGDQPLAGMGFTPSLAFLIGADNNPANMNVSWGWSNLIVNQCFSQNTTGTQIEMQNLFCIHIERDGANLLRGVISAFGADGLTITWTLVGACACNFTILAIP